MTNISSDQPDFDFWEFVSCAKCQLSFSSDATVPFWLTQCGHVICNNHLNSDQSCSQCGSQGIQLAPLQREMGSPMSEWFCSIPMSLNSIAFTAKFQQDTMASQIQHFKAKYRQLRHFAERLKCDMAELEKTNGALQSENNQLRMQLDHRLDDQVPSISFNSNGKRQMSTNPFGYSNRQPTTNSSHISTPLGPARLTLAPGQQLPELSSHEQQNLERSQSRVYAQENQGHFSSTLQKRPISSRSLEQYVYVPPDTARFKAQQSSYPHADPKTFQSTSQQERSQGLPPLPPPTSRFTPALVSNKAQFPSNGTSGFPRQTNMGPPPTPQRFRTQASPSNGTDNPLPPPSRRQRLQNTDTAIPGTSSTASQRFFQTRGSNLNSRPSVPNNVREHRMPFVPESAVSQ